MKAKLLLICLLGLFFSSVQGQSLIQGTIKPGATASEIEIWLKPNFTNSTQYLFQIGFPIAFPASAAPQPSGLNITLDPGFTSSFGTNYTVTVNPVATATGGAEKYFNIVLVRAGAGASVAQNWTAGTEFKVLKATFAYSGSPATFSAKLADYQDGGSDGQGNFYTQSGNNDFYVTSNSIGNFYSSAGNSVAGGTAAAGYAQLMAAVNAGTVSGSSPLCVGGTATYTSNGDAGGTWSSTNTAVASVNASTGLVTALSAGTTNITYTISGVPAFKTLTVNALPTVAAITGTTSLITGGTTQLSDASAGGTWSSSNTSVATVNGSGLVTGVSAGTSTISYKVTNSCGTTTVTALVTVVQPLIQGTIKPGAGTNDIEVWLKPNFSNSTQYLFQIGMPIAYPASATPTSLNVTLDPAFVSAFGNNYSVTVNPIATATGGTEKYFNIVLIRGGAGASTAQNWTGGTEFKVLTATFVPSSAPGSLVKLADYQDGGSDGQGNFYTQDGNGNYYISSNSINNFYAASGQSTVGGNASVGYAQTIASIGCSMPSVGAISGAGSVCAGSTTQLSDATAGGVWSSGNTAVATVNASGLVTGVAGGSVTISYAVTNGCGTTTVTKSITVNQPASSSFSASACGSYTLPWGGSVTASGDYVHTYQTVGGCDSVVTAHVTINTSLSSSFSASACGSYTLPWGGSVTTSGDYTHTYQAVSGCDSVVTGHVTINNAASSSFTASACNSYTLPWGGSVTTSGDYVHTYQTVKGCDSVVTAHVTINNGTSSSFTASACGSYTLPWGGSVATSGDYVHTYQTVGGCDSVVTAHVTINTVPTVAPITGTTNISTGGTTQLSDVTAGGVWSSNNTGVASVNASGLVTAVSAGSATISYKVTNGCGTTTVTTVVSVGQSLIQGTIKSGSSSNEIEVWLKPNFNNSTQYLFQIGMPIAYPASASPTALNITLDPGFVSAFGNNYAVTVNPIATAAGGTEKYFNIVLIRGGAGASDPQTWTAGTEFKVLTASFVPSSAPGSAVKFADYQDGGSDGQGNFYTQDGNSNYYITSNSIGNFYAAAGQSTVGGNALAGYAQTIASIGCSVPVVSGISGSATVCTGSSVQLSDATAGGVWSSDNTSVATVNASGLVTGVAAGSVTISYAVINACGTTTVTYGVTVHSSSSSSFLATACNSYTLPWGGSITSSGAYVHTYVGANGCDSVVTANVTINHSATSSFNAAACGSYTLPWGGSVTASGDYVHTYQTISGCDSVVTAHVTINTSLSSSFNAAACGSYNLPWGGSVTSSGDYVHTYQAVSGCDSVVTAHVTINTSLSSSFNASACGSYTLPWGGSVTTSGDYVHTYQAVSGCDSVVTAHVTINNGTSSSFTASACNTYTLPWGGSVTNSGAYVHTYVGANGCDSVVTAHVTINHSATSSFNAAACGSYTLPWGGSVTTSGDYVHTYQTISGCDSVVTAHVTINTSLSSSFNASACGSYNLPWGGSVTTSGDYVHTYQAVSGCDSVVTAHVTINNSTSSSFTATACNSYTLPWGGSVTTSGAYTHTYVGSTGCDSVVTANVTIRKSTSSTTTVTICANLLPYVWNSNSYTAAGTYTVHLSNAAGCDSATTLVLNVTPLVSAGTVNGTSPLTVGATATYTSTGAAGGTWSSSNTAVATVNTTTGLVTAVSAGTTNITYTVNTGCGSPVSSFKALTVSTATGSISVNCPGSITATTTVGCSKSIATGNPTYSGPVTALTWTMSGATTGSSAATGINYVGTKTFNVGTTTVTYTVKDAAGHTATCSFTVKVVDTQNPTIVCPADITTSVTSGCSKSITIPNPSYSDNCSVNRLVWAMVGATNAVSPLNGINVIGTKTFNVGVTQVIYVVTDASGNFATSSFTVTVKDNINPVISCPGAITQTAATGKCSKDVSTPNPVFSDNCSCTTLTWKMTGATTGSSSSSGINYVGTKTFKAGTTTVTYTVKDLSGNTSSCSFTVKINASGNCSTSTQGSGGYTHPGVAGHLFDIRTFPNPSSHYFNLRIQSSSQGDVEISISDLTGRVIQRLKGAADQSFQFGDRFIPGTYMIEVRQGGERVIRKLVKY